MSSKAALRAKRNASEVTTHHLITSEKRWIVSLNLRSKLNRTRIEPSSLNRTRLEPYVLPFFSAGSIRVQLSDEFDLVASSIEQTIREWQPLLRCCISAMGNWK
jgi:hypothetical protein